MLAPLWKPESVDFISVTKLLNFGYLKPGQQRNGENDT